MSKLHPFPQVLVAGALAALLTSVLIWLLTVTGIFVVLAVPVAAPEELAEMLPWATKRMLWGALAGLTFLAPLALGLVQWKRGVIASLVPILVLLVVIYPQGHEGFLGLNLGFALLAAVIFFWLLWGGLAGWLLGRWGFDGWVSAPPA